MKKRIISLILAVAVMFSISIPVNAAPPALTLNDPFGVSIDHSDKTFTYDFKVNGSIDANTLKITYDENVATIGLKTDPTTLVNLNAGTTYKLSFNVANTIVAGSYSLKFTLDFEQSGVDKTQDVYVPVFVSEVNQVLIKNIDLPSSAVAGESTTIGFDVINEGSDIDSVTISIKNSSGKVLESKYASTIESGSTKPYEFKITAPSSSETLYATVDYSFNGSTYTKSESFKLNYGTTGSSLGITIRNIVCPSKAIVKESNTLSFDIINSTSIPYVSCEATISDGTYSYGYTFVGNIAENAATPVKIDFTCNNKKTYNFTANLTYKDASGCNYKKSFTFSVTASAQVLGTETGKAKIQFISSPMYSQMGASNEFSFDLTNPTTTDIKGAEAFLYDEDGNLADSVYISSISANNSSTVSMTYIPLTTGTHTYKISIQYLDNNNNKQIITGSFNTNVKMDASAAADGKPANVKIAKIDNPARVYTNVATSIPFTIVNAGKGDAYNAEVVVTDSLGNEISRDYIGSIASGKMDCETKVKFSETGNQDLTLSIYYENFDETIVSVSKNFTQSIADYRVTIGELSGFEWLIEGEQATLSFSIQNLGSLELLNTTANLVDQNGNIVGNCFVGVVAANSKSENLKFKKLMLMSDVSELSVQISYENAGGDIFSASTEAPTFVHVMTYEEAYGGGGDIVMPEYGLDEDGNQIIGFDEAGNAIIGYNEDGSPILSGQSSGGGFPVWGWILIGVGVAAVVVVVIIIIKKKKKKADDSDDMDYFYSQNKEEKSDDNIQNQ